MHKVNSKSVKLQVRFKPLEAVLIKSYAKNNGISISEIMRRGALNLVKGKDDA